MIASTGPLKRRVLMTCRAGLAHPMFFPTLSLTGQNALRRKESLAGRRVTCYRSRGLPGTSLPIPRRGCRFPPPSRRSMISDSPCPSSTPLQTCTRSSRDSLHPVVWCRIGLWEKVLRTPEFPLPVFNSEEVCCFVELAGRLF